MIKEISLTKIYETDTELCYTLRDFMMLTFHLLILFSLFSDYVVFLCLSYSYIVWNYIIYWFFFVLHHLITKTWSNLDTLPMRAPRYILITLSTVLAYVQSLYYSAPIADSPFNFCQYWWKTTVHSPVYPWTFANWRKS
jgi:hypothetical protein